MRESCRLDLSASTGKHHGNGTHNDLEVEPDAPIIDIGHVERDVTGEGWVLAALDLPEAGDSGSHVETAQVVEIVLAHFAGQGWTRAYDAHLSAENIDELGQLVK